MKTCEICGNPIDADSKAKKYCSPECRARVKYEKDRAWLKSHPGKAAEYSRKYYETHKEEYLRTKREAYRVKCIERYKENG